MIFFLVGAFSAICCFAQVNPQTLKQPQRITLQQQYNSLKLDVEVLDGYRMMKIIRMDRLWAGVEDSLAVQKSKLNESLNTINDQKNIVKRLNAALETSERERGDLSELVDNITFLGISFSKSGFVITISVILSLLLIVIVALLFVAKVSNLTTKELRKLNDNIYQEFDSFKRHAVEREVKILRELQDCRNKLAELRTA